MNTSKPLSGLFALALAAGAVGGTARAQSDHDSAHHPGAAQTQTAPAPPAGMPMRERSGQGGMMDSGQGGMMGGDMQPMMRMMHERMAREEMDGPMGMMHLDHIEGRIAFLKTELGITDAQKPQWDAFADALRTQAGRMKSVREEIMQGRAPETWPDLLGREEHMLLVRVNALKAIEEPARALYAALSPEQQKKANELMRHPMGGL